MLSERTSDRTVYMPSDGNKKEIPVTMKLSEQQLLMLEDICARHDRPRSYVARELMLRGIALYKQDGKIREADEVVRTVTFREKDKEPYTHVLASIEPGTSRDDDDLQREEIRRQLQDDGVQVKTNSKRPMAAEKPAATTNTTGKRRTG